VVIDQREAHVACLSRRKIRRTGTDNLAIFGELTGQEEFRRIVRQATYGDWFDDSL